MTGHASSFELRTSSVKRAAEAFAARGSSSSTLLFVTGKLAQEIDELATELGKRREGGRVLLAPVAGVLTERGEIEQEDAVVGMHLPASSARFVLSPTTQLEFGEALVTELHEQPATSVLVLLRGQQSDDGWLAALDAHLGVHEERFFGGGTLPHRPLWLVDSSGARSGAAAAVLVERPWVGRIAASSACRLLSPLVTVTRTRGAMLLEIGGMPALSMLTSSAQAQEERPHVLIAIAKSEGALSAEGRSLALRAIVGVDPERGGIMLTDPLPEGTKVAFAVRDAHGARVDLEAHLRTLRRNCAGTAPTFGFFVSCAGRGRSLYETASVDVRLIQQHFPDMPLVGLHSTFELAPLDGRLTPQIHTGIVSVFSAPS